MKKQIYWLMLILMVSLLAASCDANSTTGTTTPAEGNQKPLNSFTTTSSILDLLVDGKDLWAATAEGVIRWNIYSGTSQKYTTKDGLSSDINKKIIRDTNGNIWTIAYIAGVNRFASGKWQSFNVKNGLCSDDAVTLAADKKGGVWVSAYWGVSYYDGEQWSSYSNHSPDDMITGGPNPMKGCLNLTMVEAELGAVDVILVDTQENIWFSSRTKGVTRYDGRNWKTFSTEDGLIRGGVTSIFEDKNNKVWLAGNIGVSYFDGSAFKNLIIDKFQATIPRPYIQDMRQDTQGNIWVAAYQGGVCRFDGTTWQSFSTTDGLPSDNIQSTFLDRKGNLAVLTDKGVSRFDSTGWLTLTTNDGLPEGKVSVVFTDDQGNLWFGSEKGEITRLEEISTHAK